MPRLDYDTPRAERDPLRVAVAVACVLAGAIFLAVGALLFDIGRGFPERVNEPELRYKGVAGGAVGLLPLGAGVWLLVRRPGR